MSASNRNLIQRDLRQFRRAVAAQAEAPPNNDQYFGSLAQAIYIETDHGGSLRPETEEQVFGLRRDTDNAVHPIRVAPNLVTRAVHRQALGEIGRYDYLRYFDPARGQGVEKYQDFIRNSAVGSDEFSFDLAVRTVQSNLFARGEAQKLMMMLFPERYGANPSMFEAGCSLNHILKWLVEGVPTNPTVLDVDGTINNEMTRNVRRLLIGRLALKYGLGLDQWDYRSDHHTSDWELACSTTPNDMLNRPKMVDETIRLSSINPPQVLFHGMNFLDSYDVNLFPPQKIYGKHIAHAAEQPPPLELDIDEFDTAFSATTTYLLRNKAERQKLQDFMMDNTRADGIIANQDFGTVNPNAPCGLDVPKNIYARDFIYNYAFYDKLNPAAGWQHGFTFKNGRAEQMIVGDGVVMVDGQTISIRERLLEAA